MRFHPGSVARRGLTAVLMSALVVANAAVAEEVPQIALAQPTAAATAEPPTLWLKMAGDEKVAFSGQINYDNAGIKGTQMLYPAPSFVGFLAAIATHGTIASAQRNSEKEAMRTRADKILTGYQPLLDEFKTGELASASLGMVNTPGKKQISHADSQIGPHDITIETQPKFIITQDQRAIILENAISILVGGNATPYLTQIRVLSNDIGEDAPAKAWTDEQGRKLKEESSRLLATSLELALDNMQATGKAEGVQKTLRFQEGGKEKIERGLLVREDCGRIFFKSLRDELISAPKKNSSCGDGK